MISSAVLGKLTTAATRLSDVVHDITFLHKEIKNITVILSSVCFWTRVYDKTVVRWDVLTVRPGSPSGPGSPCRERQTYKSQPASQLGIRQQVRKHQIRLTFLVWCQLNFLQMFYLLYVSSCMRRFCVLTSRPPSPLGPLSPGSPGGPGSPC